LGAHQGHSSLPTQSTRLHRLTADGVAGDVDPAGRAFGSPADSIQLPAIVLFGGLLGTDRQVPHELGLRDDYTERKYEREQG
jgi:hypothetical protein